MKGGKNLRIAALASSRGGGDWHPTFALASGLRLRGHDVAIICDYSVSDLIGPTPLRVVLVPAQPANRNREGERDGAEKGEPDPLLHWANSAMPVLEKVFSCWKPNLILSPLMGMRLAIALSNRNQVPWCLVNPSFYFGENPRHTWEDDFHPRARDRFRTLFGPLSRRANIVLHSTLPEFDIAPELPPNHFMVGPILWDGPLRLSSVKRASNTILLSVSTAPQDDELRFIRAALQGLATQNLEVTLTFPSASRPLIDAEHVGRATLLSFVPHSHILPRINVHISHGGHGTVMRDLAHGVPMVLVPWDRDQPGVSARAVRLGVGLAVQRDSCSAKAISECVANVLGDNRFHKRAESFSQLMQSRDSVRTAAAIIEDLVS